METQYISIIRFFALLALLSISSLQAFAAPLDRDAVRAQLQDFTRAGMDRRLGPDYAAYHNGNSESFPTVWMIPTRQDAIGRPYQLGGPWVPDPGLYSSTQGQLLYAPDPGAFGVDRVHILEWMHGTFSEKPEPPWWGGFRPEPISQNWIANANGGNPGMPIAMVRGMGGWANCGVIIFSSGLVGAAGTHTASGTNPTWQFPPHKVLTSIVLTPKSEFALITLTDTRTRKGQVAVIALQNGGWTGFVHDWQGQYPCLPGTAWLSGMKLLGYVDLPGMEFPTGIAAAGNDVNRWVFGTDGHVAMLNAWDPSQQATRDAFRTGRNAGYASTAGYAVAISRHENKAVFIDLQPLFRRVHDLYFTTESNFQKTRNLGPGPTQWPYTFAADPGYKPKVTKVISVPEPTAIVTGLARGDRSRVYIASLDGTVGSYAVGGLATDAPAQPSQIQRVAETRVGRNPTCLTAQKYVNDTIIAVSRGDREISWIKDELSSTRVIRRLRDSRLIDPVYCEMADTHGIEASIITVADFNGRKALNYRFDRVVFELQGGAIFGMGPTGTDEFECGGVLDFPGSPFCVSATNVN